MTRPRNPDSRRGTLARAAGNGSIELHDEDLEAAVRAEIGEDYDDSELITEYLAGDLSPADRQRVEERLRTDEKFRALAEPLIMVWNRSVPLERKEDLATQVAAERSWQKLKKRIELEEQGIYQPTLQEKRAKRRRRRARLLGTIGALIASLFGIWLRPQLFPAPTVYVHVDASVDAERVARLPDETKVTLAPGSHLRYRDWFTPHDEREVTLNGQGTFTVARGAREAMTIRGAGVEVSASNARFTIHAYDTEPIAYVIVHEGRAVVRTHTGYRTSQSLTLSAGEGARVGPKRVIVRDDAPFPLHR